MVTCCRVCPASILIIKVRPCNLLSLVHLSATARATQAGTAHPSICRLWQKTSLHLLAGSWVVISGVLTILITQIRGLITPLITTHEPSKWVIRR